MKRDHVVLYRDRQGDWRWRYLAQNGQALADGGQGYSRRIDAQRGAQRVTGGRLRRRVEFVDGPDEAA